RVSAVRARRTHPSDAWQIQLINRQTCLHIALAIVAWLARSLAASCYDFLDQFNFALMTQAQYFPLADIGKGLPLKPLFPIAQTAPAQAAAVDFANAPTGTGDFKKFELFHCYFRWHSHQTCSSWRLQSAFGQFFRVQQFA